MKPSKAAVVLADKALDVASMEISYGFSPEVHEEVARLIDEHVKGLIVSLKQGRDCIESNFDPGPIPASEPTDRDLDVGFAIANAEAALKPWTEPAN